MCPGRNAAAKLPPRRGITYLELMISMAVSTILVASLTVLAEAVHVGAQFNTGQNDALQHARVTLDRIQRTVNESYATEAYPGVVVLGETVGGYRYPDTLVVWHPAGTPVNPAGPPLVNELVIVCPNPSNAGELIEVTAPGDTRTVQLNEASLNTSTGRSFIQAIVAASSSTKTQLTPLLRSAATGSTSSSTLRGCVRFECELHPTDAELSLFRSGTGTWEGLGWPQSTYSGTFGLRQVWLRTELQLLSEPRNSDGTLSPTASTLPFLGSSTKYYTISK